MWVCGVGLGDFFVCGNQVIFENELEEIAGKSLKTG